MTWWALLYLYFVILLAGWLLEVSFLRLYFYLTRNHIKTHHFSLSKYVVVLIPPILSTFLVVFLADKSVLLVLLIFAFVGTFFEWLVGYVYYSIVGSRLWTYHKFSIGPYTSFLSIPLWALAGGLFYVLAKTLI